MKQVDENGNIEVKWIDIHNIILNGGVNDYVFKIPESLHIQIPEDLNTKDTSLSVYLLLSLLGYKPEVKEKWGK